MPDPTRTGPQAADASDPAERTRACIERHWSVANARDWDRFETLLDPALRYRAPQTREHLEGADGYVELFRTWPGDWQATVRELVCEAQAAVCRIDFAVDGETMTGISFFRLGADGRITDVTDWWPEPYEPPPRQTSRLLRDPAP